MSMLSWCILPHACNIGQHAHMRCTAHRPAAGEEVFAGPGAENLDPQVAEKVLAIKAGQIRDQISPAGCRNVDEKRAGAFAPLPPPQVQSLPGADDRAAESFHDALEEAASSGYTTGAATSWKTRTA